AIAGLFLVGGSSRIPLVATLLHEVLGIAPIVGEQPELVVAEGSLHVRQQHTMPTPTVPPTPPVSPAPPPRPTPPPRQGRNGGLLAVAVAAGVVLLLLLIGVPISLYALQGLGSGDSGQDPLAGSTTSASPAVSGPKYDVKKVPENLCAVVDLSA